MDSEMESFIEQRYRKMLSMQKEEQTKEAKQSDIYAEISKKQLKEIDKWILPTGARLKRKNGSRACFFECEDDMAREDLIEFLEQKGISWQEND